MKTQGSVRLVVAFAAMLLLVVSCGGGEGTGAANGDSGSTPSPADDAQTEAAPDEGAASAEETSGASAEETSGGATAAVADFYEGKTVTMIVGLSAGGSFDVLARLLAQHMPKHMPGNPEILVENMTGAGSMVAANHLYNVAPADGTVVGTFLSSLINQEILANQGVEYEMAGFQWLFAMGANRGVCIARTDSGVTQLEDTMPPESKPVTLGYTGPGSPGYDYGLFFREALGANVELVGGYDGNAEVRLAVERGEIDGYCVVYETAVAEHADWEASGDPEFEYFVHLSPEPMDELPNATYAYDLLEGDDQAVFELMIAQNEVFWPFAAPPGVPEERVDALRQAAQDTFADPEFQAAVESSGLLIDPVPGDEVQAFMEGIAEAPAPVLERFKELFAN